jgi:hypothetical protein
MRVERGNGLLKIGGRFELRRFEFDSPRFVIEMDAENLGRVAGWQISRLGFRDLPSVAEAKPVSFDLHPLGLTLMEDAAPLFSRSGKYTHY